MRSSRCKIIGLGLLCLCLACASSKAPRGWLPSASRAASSVYGSWIEVKCPTDFGTDHLRGEFLTVDNDSLFVMSTGGLLARPLSEVSKATVVVYDSKHGQLSTWTLVGTLSTGSHGVVLVISAPIWILTGSVITSSRSHEPVYSLRHGDWDALMKFARYPTGMPVGLDRNRL